MTGGVLARRTGSDRPNADGAAAPLRGTVWQLVDGVSGRNSDATLHIDRAGKLVADDSCAVVGARARVSASALTITDQIVRDRGCTDSVGETVFTTDDLKLLRVKASYTIAGRRLTISRSGANSMHLQVKTTPPPTLDVPTLVGARWQLVAAKDAAGHAVTVTPKTLLTIDDHGKMTASDGCNGLTASVRGQESRIHITRTGFQTQVGCPTADVVDTVLDGTVDQIVKNGYLTLTKPGAGALTYRWASNSAETDPNALTNKTWRLSAVGSTPAAGTATLRIDSHGNISGRDGCRIIAGTAQVQPGTATVNLAAGLGSSPRCSRAVSDQAATTDSFLRIRQIVWSVRDGTLVVDGGGSQAFAAFYRVQRGGAGVSSLPKALVGTWTLLDFSTPAGRVTPASPIVLTLRADGTTRVSKRCSQDNGVAQARGNRLVLDVANTTFHSCPLESSAQRRLDQQDAEHADQVLRGTAAWG